MTRTKNPYPLPDAGANRFWFGRHNPTNAKFPMVLELRESTIDIGDREPKANFSVLIAKQPVIADPKVIAEAAGDLLIRASRVREFEGILTAGGA